MFGSFDISTSALAAQRMRLTTIASNMANIDTTHDASGKYDPYRRMDVVFQAQRTADGGMGVRVSKVLQDPSPLKVRYEPWNPDKDADGYVYYPNVDLPTEYINALEATRAYEANATAIETTKAMMNATLRLLG